MPASTDVISVVQEVSFTLVFVHARFTFRHDRFVGIARDFCRIPHYFFFVIRFDDTTTLKTIPFYNILINEIILMGRGEELQF